jgi:hypothetical protein
MFPFDRHEQLRQNLSAYADGELSPRDTARVEAHLATCDDCYSVLDGLRMTSAALGGLPVANAPRSFALTPELANAPSTPPASRSSPAYANGLRLAAAGLAVALAVVMVVDRSNFGGEGDSGGSQVQGLDGRLSETLGATEESAADQGAFGGQADSAAGTPQATGGPAASAAPLASSPPSAFGAAPSEEYPARASEAPQPAVGDTGGENNTETESSGDETATGGDETKADGNDFDGMAVVEVVLGALLVATLTGLALVWVAKRRRSV